MTIDKDRIVASIERSLKFYEYELTVPLTNFIFRTPLHWNVMLIIALATFKDEYVASFQDICKSIPSKVGSKSSIQPMGSLFEQTLLLTLECIAGMIMQEKKMNSDSMFVNHANLE